ncbi:MAG TPA: hypothetical protein VL523_02045 [Terriglobia bacterium]|nr:hypothetical protein [Terriglobia bacterium]
MPKAKQSQKSGARREPPEIPPLAFWFMREILPLLRPRRRRPSSKSARHLKNAGIEMLEAMRAFLDEAIECLRKEESEAPMKRIEVED